jgi:hypothetical protein
MNENTKIVIDFLNKVKQTDLTAAGSSKRLRSEFAEIAKARNIDARTINDMNKLIATHTVNQYETAK